MPYIDVTTNISLGEEKTGALKSDPARGLAASFPGKTENWLMLNFRENAAMYFAGDAAPCAMIDVHLFGAQAKKNYDAMTSGVTKLVAETCGIPENRIYIKYAEYDKWGWNGSNF